MAARGGRCARSRRRSAHPPGPRSALVPELPEVETLRRDLDPEIVGREILKGWISENAPRLVQGMPPQVFLDSLARRRFTGTSRRGKYLVLELDDGTAFILHLRMTGQLLLVDPQSVVDPYARARFWLDDGRELRFRDVRKFGTMWHVADRELVLHRLGLEPLSDEFTTAALYAALARRAAPVKAVLLDQHVIAGLGNIYVDEALHLARVHPLAPARDLSRRQAGAIREGAVRVLEQALSNRGSSFRDYVDSRGRPGSNVQHLRVYKRTGEPCLSCGREIVRTLAGGRSTHYCPGCQRRPRRRATRRVAGAGV
ncbi:MAG: bifunctional DNA-formamidopyrimidine glycosylase/DNA-(apurinic or apyrimidinic site) lyase [Dehalococcoidia bacterium]|nr:bifunctional DNA-formamidopyrimidine glycosylase/DNA-(apurinic or apyrimidinic site) lyase [Dehalococcoidia bacterium]